MFEQQLVERFQFLESLQNLLKFKKTVENFGLTISSVESGQQL